MHFSSSSSFLGLLFILLLCLAEAGLNFRLFRQCALQQREEHAQREADRHLKLLAKDWSYRGNNRVIEKTFKQPLNHFNKRFNLTFNQRYWVFEGYWKKPNGPIFLFIGGAYLLSSTSVLAGHHVELAKKYGALLLALEHRFYGASINPDGLVGHNLKFLKSIQALWDLAFFHRIVSKKYKLTTHNTWICFGGSYAGNLAAWFRLKFPHLVFAAVASSAPVKAQLDFTGHNQVVGRALQNPDLGGSQECRKAVAEAFSKVDDMLRAGDRVQIEKDFCACNPIGGPDDFSVLVNNLAIVFINSVQYNSKYMSMPSVKFLCDMMTNHKNATAYSRLIAVNQMYLHNNNLVCTESSHLRDIQILRSTDISMSKQSNRQWFFQTCTELGYFLTCKYNTCPFSRYMTLQYELDTCKQVFNIATDHDITRHVDFTNNYYGANNPNVSRVLFVNGDMDPWHVLSVLRNQSGNTAILIKGTSHGSDIMPSRPDDPLPLVEAKKQISSQVGTWLELARNMG